MWEMILNVFGSLIAIVMIALLVHWVWIMAKPENVCIAELVDPKETLISKFYRENN